VFDIQKRADYLVKLFKQELYETPSDKPEVVEVTEKPEKRKAAPAKKKTAAKVSAKKKSS